MKTILIFTLSIILSINIFSQQKNYIPIDNMFYTNIITIPNYVTDSIDIYLCYTFYYSDLVFQKTDLNKYYAMPELEVTFKDSEGITRKRFITNDTIVLNNYDETQQNNSYLNVAQFSLINDNYKIESKFNNSKNRTFPIEHTISKYSDSNKLVNMFILSKVENDKLDISVPFNPFYTNNNCISFYSNNFTIFIPTKSENRNYNFTIEKVENKNELNWKSFEKIEGTVDKIEKNKIDSWKIMQYNNYGKNQNYDFNFKDFITITFTNNQNNYTQTEKYIYQNFITGKYILTISDGNTKTEFPFEIKWYNMPKSLVNPIYALEQMRLILTNEEYKNMESKDKNEVFANIMNYWNSTHYRSLNENNYTRAMIKFFERVDYAEVHFKTLIQKEGAKSDRGKIYILNGAPDEINNNINGKKTNEIWSYKKLNKKYIFEIVSVGNYKLIKIEE